MRNMRLISSNFVSFDSISQINHCLGSWIMWRNMFLISSNFVSFDSISKINHCLKVIFNKSNSIADHNHACLILKSCKPFRCNVRYFYLWKVEKCCEHNSFLISRIFKHFIKRLSTTQWAPKSVPDILIQCMQLFSS